MFSVCPYPHMHDTMRIWNAGRNFLSQRAMYHVPQCRGTWGLTEWSRVVSLICGKAGDEKGRILVDGTTALSVGSPLAQQMPLTGNISWAREAG